MIKVVSTVWPWDKNKFTQDDVVRHALALGADEVCIRTPEYINSYNRDWQTVLAHKLRANGIEISLWPVVAFRFPEQEAEAIAQDVAHYRPRRIVLDAEIKTWSANIDEFLEALGRQPVPVGLGSYRRANYHPEMRWQAWLKAKSGGQYQIDFLAHQLYPIGWTRPQSWAYQFRLDIDSHELELAKAGRPGLPWLPWMPAFIGGSFEGASGWTPGVDAVKSAIEYTTARLGSRLLGFNWWSLDRHLVELGDLYQYVKSTPGGGSHDGGGGPSTDPDNDLAQQLFERALTAQREALEATEALQGVLPGV